MNDIPLEIQKNIESIGKFLKYIIIFIVVVFLIPSTFFTVEPEEVGIIQRFGEFTRQVGPGLHFKLPLGIEKKTNIPVDRIQKEEFGFRTIRPGVKSEFASAGYNDESLMLTGDLNIADVTWVVQYKINDPYKFLFKVRNVRKTLRDMSESVMRTVIGDKSIDEIITLSTSQIQDEAAEKLQGILDKYETGIKIDLVKLGNVNPPGAVKASFNEVNEAKQDKDRLKNEAQQERNKKVPLALGEKKKLISEAEGYAINRKNRAMGDAARFKAVLKEYKKDKDVTRKRLYLEKLLSIFLKVKNKTIIDESLKSSFLSHLQLRDK